MVRIYAELIDSRDGSTMWSQHYDRQYKDLFRLQDDITNAVAGVLKTKLLGGNNVVVQNDRPPNGNLDAYNAYLQGKFYLARQNQADIRNAIDSFTTATKIDPRYAEAWANLSNAWSDLGQEFLSGASALAAYAEARSAVNTALALSPNLANAHSAKANLLLSADSNWTGAESEFRRALQLEPNLAAAKGNLGAVLGTLGHPEMAADLTRQALSSDPLYAFWFDQLSRFLGMLGRLDEAAQAERKRSAKRSSCSRRGKRFTYSSRSSKSCAAIRRRRSPRRSRVRRVLGRMWGSHWRARPAAIALQPMRR
jgi:tetratricopeptide (TPR) repeat protein